MRGAAHAEPSGSCWAGRSRASSAPTPQVSVLISIYEAVLPVTVFNKTWSKTLGSNQRLWKQTAYEKKHRLLCRKSVFLTFALHPSLSPCESGFSSTPRLNFLSALGECQSKSGSPARKPPQQLGRWLPPSAPLLPFCQAGDFCRIDWLSALCTSGSAHRKWNLPGYVRQAGCHMSSPVIFVPNEQGCRLKPPFYCYLLNTSVTVVSSVSSSAFNCAGDVF